MKIVKSSRKTIFTILMTSILLLSQSVPVSAQNFGIPGLIKDVNNYQNQASRAAAQQQRKLSDVISHADTLITNRITTLNTLNIRIQNDTQLTVPEKTTLAGQIQAAISGLTTLKAKIDADTTTQQALS